MTDMLDHNRHDYEFVRKLVAEQLGPKIEEIVHKRMDALGDQLKKVELIDRIITDIKELFK